MSKYLLGLLLLVVTALFILPHHSTVGKLSPEDSTNCVYLRSSYKRLQQENDSLRKALAIYSNSSKVPTTLLSHTNTRRLAPQHISDQKSGVAKSSIPAKVPPSHPKLMARATVIPQPVTGSKSMIIDQDSVIGRTHLLQDSVRKQRKRFAKIVVEMENACSLQITTLQDSIRKLNARPISISIPDTRASWKEWDFDTSGYSSSQLSHDSTLYTIPHDYPYLPR